MTRLGFGVVILLVQLCAVTANAEPVLTRQLIVQGGTINPDADETLLTFNLFSPDNNNPNFSLFFQTKYLERWRVQVRDGLATLSVSGTHQGHAFFFIDDTLSVSDDATFRFSIETSPSPIRVAPCCPNFVFADVTKFIFTGALTIPTHPLTYEFAGAGAGALRLFVVPEFPPPDPIPDGTYPLRDPSDLGFTPSPAPIPEPSPLLLMTGAGLAVGMWRRLRS